MSIYTPTIGLEVHAELKTKTKMFCESPNNPDETTPNVNVCPICMGHPGTLPVINKEAVRNVLKMGLALEGGIADYTEFDRKNYFYPDLPKGYQISQYAFPLVCGGSLAGVAVTRVHLEEDTARSMHERGNYSVVDFNRAGIPLMELVTDPVIHDAATAGRFARELQLLIRSLGIGEANMEKGQMRVEANISVSRDNNKGTKVEVKNLNSFRSVERAILFEIERQTRLLEEGGRVVQETRGWDEGKQETYSQRIKEESHDYRYFPDPDLPKLQLSTVPECSAAQLRQEMPELPAERRARYQLLGIEDQAVETLVYDAKLGNFFDAIVNAGLKKEEINRGVNYLVSDTLGILKGVGKTTEDIVCSPEAFADLIAMLGDEKISSRGAKDILPVLLLKGGSPEAIARDKQLMQVSDAGALEKVALQIIAAHPKVAEEYKEGKEASLQFLIGQGMKETKGSASPTALRDALIAVIQTK